MDNPLDQTALALAKLNELKTNKVKFQYPIFFVPGWTDEICACWKQPNQINRSLEQWFKDISINYEIANFIDFIAEIKQCNSFLDCGEILKKQVWNRIGKNQPFDLVGHSMGGLNIRAAITQGEPLLNCHVCISVATPHQGDNFGGVMNFLMKKFPKIVQKIKGLESYQVEQGKNLDPDYPPIKLLNTLDNRRIFLEKIGKLYEMKGTRDFLVKGSAFMNKTGIETLYSNKVEEIPVSGCDHVGNIGITQDPRTILAIVYILCGIRLDLGRNYGIFARGIYRPGDEKNRFV